MSEEQGSGVSVDEQSGAVSVTAPSPEETVLDPNKWYLSEDHPMEGEKPEWFDSKSFKTIEDQIKNLQERNDGLRQRLTNQDWEKAPEHYEVNLKEEFKDVSLNQEDPLFQGMAKILKAHNVPQSIFDEMVNQYVESQVVGQQAQHEKEVNALEAHQEAELQKLGKDADLRLNSLDQWAKNVFPPEVYQSWSESIRDASDVQMWETLKDQYIQKTNIAGRLAQDPQYQSLEKEAQKLLKGNWSSSADGIKQLEAHYRNLSHYGRN